MRVLITPQGPRFLWAVIPPCHSITTKSFGEAPTKLEAAKAAVAYAQRAVRSNDKVQAPTLQEVMAHD